MSPRWPDFARAAIGREATVALVIGLTLLAATIGWARDADEALARVARAEEDVPAPPPAPVVASVRKVTLTDERAQRRERDRRQLADWLAVDWMARLAAVETALKGTASLTALRVDGQRDRAELQGELDDLSRFEPMRARLLDAGVGTVTLTRHEPAVRGDVAALQVAAPPPVPSRGAAVPGAKVAVVVQLDWSRP